MSELIKVKAFAEVQRFSEPYFSVNAGSLDARIPLQSQQSMANSIEIGQRTGHEQSIGILHETAIAHLGETEDALDDQERMLDFGAHLRLGGVLRLLGRGEWIVSRGLVVGEVQGVGRMRLDDFGLTGICR